MAKVEVLTQVLVDLPAKMLLETERKPRVIPERGLGGCLTAAQRGAGCGLGLGQATVASDPRYQTSRREYDHAKAPSACFWPSSQK